jgi:hypothetical protein
MRTTTTPTTATTATTTPTTATTPFDAAIVAQLARALLPRALKTYRALGADALAALDPFLAAPGPATFLRAARALLEAERDAHLAPSSSPLAARSRDRALARAVAFPALDDATRALLSLLPADARAGSRLTALAALLEAHAELADRVREHDARRLGVLKPGLAEVALRKPPPKKPAAVRSTPSKPATKPRRTRTTRTTTARRR